MQNDSLTTNYCTVKPVNHKTELTEATHQRRDFKHIVLPELACALLRKDPLIRPHWLLLLPLPLLLVPPMRLPPRAYHRSVIPFSSIAHFCAATLPGLPISATTSMALLPRMIDRRNMSLPPGSPSMTVCDSTATDWVLRLLLLELPKVP